ncbi:hypothetical protein ABZ826_34895 [Streptomyces sp. NPDC047515]|uniref:hypothetical protein n=1 Tax=Streptomyces sp. NPDC047515 TaxID=3155380 RepID=UPI0033D12BF6
MAVKADGRRSGDTKPATHPVQDVLAHPMETMTAVVDRVPGAEVVKGVFGGVLDSVGVVSPHARRVTAYAGAGLLGAAGLIEWPVAVAGAAVVWLTQPRPEDVTEEPTGAGHGLRAKQAARSAKASTASAASRKPKPATKASTKTSAKATGAKGKAKAGPSGQRAGARKPAAAGRKKS